MDVKVFEILEVLEKYPYKINGNIADSINKNFPFEDIPDEYSFNQKRTPILLFLNGLENDGYVKYKHQERFDNSITSFSNKANVTKFIPSSLEATLTEFGRNELKNERGRKLNESVGLSSIGVNESIRGTNQSVIETNKSIIENTKSQTLVNETIAKNSIRQTEIFKRQTLILLATAVLAFGALVVSVWSIISNRRQQQLQMQLLDKGKELDSLRNQLSRLKNSTYQPTGAKTIPQKKK